MSSTLNDDSSTNKMDCSKMICFKGASMITDSWLQKLSSSCQQEFFKTEEPNIQGNRNFHILLMYSDYAINISLIIDPMKAASTKALQLTSVTFLTIIFKRHSGKAELWTHVQDAQTLNAGKLGLWTRGLCKPGRLDSGCMDPDHLNDWTLGLWKTGCSDSGCLGSGRLEVRALEA